MKYNKIIYKNKQLKRINARKAMDILDHPSKYNGVTLYYLPVNANPESPWINGFQELMMNPNNMDAVDNRNWISEYIYYNCVEDLGLYLKYYVEEVTE